MKKLIIFLSFALSSNSSYALELQAPGLENTNYQQIESEWVLKGLPLEALPIVSDMAVFECVQAVQSVEPSAGIYLSLRQGMYDDFYKSFKVEYGENEEIIFTVVISKRLGAPDCQFKLQIDGDTEVEFIYSE